MVATATFAESDNIIDFGIANNLLHCDLMKLLNSVLILFVVSVIAGVALLRLKFRE